jgi:hypothetical protein
MCEPPFNGRLFFARRSIGVSGSSPCKRLAIWLYALMPRCLVAFFPIFASEVLYFNICCQVIPATTGILKRNRVQITGCRATVCCSEWSQPHMLHNKPLYQATRVWEGHVVIQQARILALRTETNAFAVKSSSQGQLNHLTL